MEGITKSTRRFYGGSCGEKAGLSCANTACSREGLLREQEKKILENRTVLNRMVTESSEMINQIGIASMTITRLRAELAGVEHYVVNSKDYGAKLRLQAEKLDSEQAELTEKYEAILSRIQSQITEKEHAVGQVNVQRNKILAIRDEEIQRGKRLKNEIKKMDTLIKIMKHQVISSGSWNVRSSLSIDLSLYSEDTD